MRAVTASFIGFCFIIPSAWAVEVSAPVASATRSTGTPVQAVTTQAPVQGASAQKTGIIPAVATTAQTVQPTEKSRSLQKKSPSRKLSKMPKSKL